MYIYNKSKKLNRLEEFEIYSATKKEPHFVLSSKVNFNCINGTLMKEKVDQKNKVNAEGSE